MASNGPLNERLRLEFTQQNSLVRFLDVFAPVAVKQIISALEGPDKPLQYVADFHVAEDASDYVLTATILQPCEVRIEVHETLEAPLPRVKVVQTNPQRLPVLSSGGSTLITASTDTCC